MRKVFKTVLMLLVLVIAAGTAAVLSGAYNVAADVPHWRATSMLLGFARERSIETRAAGIQVPDDLDDPARIAEGAEHYNEMCTGCHLSPARSGSEMREGLYPKPPNLAEHGLHDAKDAFWTIKHGIKMTAMPAWGKTHDDEKIWDLVALLKVLPSMTAEQWRGLTENAANTEDDDGNDGNARHHVDTTGSH